MSERLLVLAIIVAVAALVGAAANAWLRKRHHLENIDPADLEQGARVVVFTSPYCHGCSQWLAALERDEVSTSAIDISKRPDAAARYKIKSTPRIAVVDPAGTVLREFHHFEPRRSDLDQILRLTKV